MHHLTLSPTEPGIAAAGTRRRPAPPRLRPDCPVRRAAIEGALALLD